MPEDECPLCLTDLTYISGARQYSRAVMVEIRGVYDGGLFMLCPACGRAYHRFNEGDRLYQIAQTYIDKHNSQRADEEQNQKNNENDEKDAHV